MKNVQHRKEHAHDSQIMVGNLQRCGHILRISGNEPSENRPAENKHHRRDHGGGYDCNHERCTHSFADPVHFFRAEVLSRIGNHGVAVGDGRHLQNAVQLIGGGKSCDKQHPKSVDHKLHNHASYGNDRVLKCHGKPQLHQMQAESSLHPEILF